MDHLPEDHHDPDPNPNDTTHHFNYEDFEFELSEYLMLDDVVVVDNQSSSPSMVSVSEQGGDNDATSREIITTTNKKSSGVVKKNKVQAGYRVAFRTKSEVEVMDDGFKWRKYGKKFVKNNPNPSIAYPDFVSVDLAQEVGINPPTRRWIMHGGPLCMRPTTYFLQSRSKAYKKRSLGDHFAILRFQNTLRNKNISLVTDTFGRYTDRSNRGIRTPIRLVRDRALTGNSSTTLRDFAGHRFNKNYYKCSLDGCNVKKRVERDKEDIRFVITTYEGVHNHENASAAHYSRMPNSA